MSGFFLTYNPAMAKFDQIPAAEQRLIESFIDHLWMENGLSDNTLSAYRNDLASFSLWLEKKSNSLINADTSLLQDYLAYNYSIHQKK